MPETSSDVRITEQIIVLLIVPEQPGFRCPKCCQIWPTEKFVGHKKTWCVYCAAEETAAKRDKVLAKRADDLAQRLISDKGLGRNAMSTVEEFFGELDVAVGGARMYAQKMTTVIDGLIDKGAFAAAGSLLLQLQKLRFLVQKQHSDEDFTQLDLEQKKSRLQLEILQFVQEQNPGDPSRQLVLESMESHGVVGVVAAEHETTLTT